jgi:hypothetical protein
LLLLQQQTAVGVTAATHSKLGPNQDQQKIGSVAYKLQMPSRVRIHDAFHLSLLKKFEGTTAQMVSFTELRQGKVLHTAEKVLCARLNRGVWELLVKWTVRSEADTTWEQLKDFKQQFPHVELADKLFVSKGAMLWTPSLTGNISSAARRKEITTKVARVGNQISPRIKEICVGLFS